MFELVENFAMPLPMRFHEGLFGLEMDGEQFPQVAQGRGDPLRLIRQRFLQRPQLRKDDFVLGVDFRILEYMHRLGHERSPWGAVIGRDGTRDFAAEFAPHETSGTVPSPTRPTVFALPAFESAWHGYKGEVMVARILIVEEHTPSLVLMLHALKGRGYATTFATDGAVVLSMARDQRPDVIVCDSRLASADGRQIVRQLLREDRLRGVTLLAVLETRLGVVGGRKTPAGFADHIDKPIDPASFLRTVERNLPPSLRAARQPLRMRGLRRKTDPAVWRKQ